jgi:hypothetical protein
VYWLTDRECLTFELVLGCEARADSESLIKWSTEQQVSSSLLDLQQDVASPNRTRVQLILHFHIHRYEVQDLSVVDVLPQMVALSESYFQVCYCSCSLGLNLFSVVAWQHQQL